MKNDTSDENSETTETEQNKNLNTDQSAVTENTEITPEIPVNTSDKEPGRLKRLWVRYLAKKKLTIPLTVLAVISILLAVPVTRYLVLGTFLSQDVPVVVLDSKTNKPVSGADVTIRSKTARTDGEGKANLSVVKVGKANLQIKKNYYKEYSQSITVGVKSKKEPLQTKLEATGRQVEITVTDKISGKSLTAVAIKAGDSEAKTDEKGLATIVLPAGGKDQKAELSRQGFNTATVDIVAENPGDKDNKFSLTASGKLYFLSKRTGKIDVVKTNLDGTDRQTVLPGTGREEEGNTVLLATRDWKYLVLQSRRDSPQPKLYLLDTSNDKLTAFDEGDASFALSGWHDQDFVYTVTRNQVPVGQPKRQALKVFHASTGKLQTIDETTGEGGVAQEIASGVSLLDQNIIYVKQWQGGYGIALDSKAVTINAINYDGSGKKDVKSLPANIYVQQLLYKPNEVYFSYYTDGKQNYLEYEDNAIKDAANESEKFTGEYPTYLLSPSGNYTLWSEPRDGKSALFLGNKAGEEGKLLDQTTKYNPYGWYSDEYILISSEGSELYVAPREIGGNATYLKVTDYHKPSIRFLGYGGGYGGL